MKKAVAVVISILIILAIMIVGLISLIDEETKENTDALKFKEEYELLNGKYYEESDITLSTLEIPKENPIKYLTDEELIAKLTEGTNIIYFGFPECVWCRRLVPVLLEFAQKNKIETIYYYNFSNLRKAYEENTDESKIKLYEKIIDILKDNITITYEEGTAHAGEKRLSAPDVYFVKDGTIVGHNYKLVESYTNYQEELTNEQKEELIQIYKSYYDKMFVNVCIEEAC